MSVYLVERNLPGITQDQLSGAQRAAIATAADMTAKGEPIEYVRSTFLLDASVCMCLFKTDAAERVARLNEQAGLPFTRIVPALDLTP